MRTKTLTMPWINAQGKVDSKIIGWTALAAAILAASTSTTFAKILTTSLSPLTLLLLSESIVLFFTVLSFGFVPLFEEIVKIKSKYVLPLLVVGLCNSVIAPMLVFSGLHLSKAVNAELFLRSYSFFLFIYATIFLKERTNRTDILALLCMLFGIMIVALRGFSGPLVIARGDILILTGAFIYALGGAVFKKHLTKLHPEVVLFSRGVMAVAFFCVVAPIIQHPFLEEIKVFPIALVGALVGYGFLSRFIYLFGFYESMERLSAHTVSLFLPLVTVGALFFSHMYLKESVYWYHITGGLFIILGSIIIQYSSTHYKGKHLDRHMRHSNRHHI